MSITRLTTFATIADKTDTVGCNTDDDVCGTGNELCLSASIKANIGYAESCFKSRPEVVNDQLELRRKDMGNLCNGSRSKTDCDRLIECLKRGV